METLPQTSHLFLGEIRFRAQRRVGVVGPVTPGGAGQAVLVEHALVVALVLLSRFPRVNMGKTNIDVENPWKSQCFPVKMIYLHSWWVFRFSTSQFPVPWFGGLVD